MADKQINELAEALSVKSNDLFVLQQSGIAKKLSGTTLIRDLLISLDGHGGIKSITKSRTEGLKDYYNITLADGSVTEYVVTNGESGVYVGERPPTSEKYNVWINPKGILSAEDVLSNHYSKEEVDEKISEVGGSVVVKNETVARTGVIASWVDDGASTLATFNGVASMAESLGIKATFAVVPYGDYHDDNSFPHLREVIKRGHSVICRPRYDSKWKAYTRDECEPILVNALSVMKKWGFSDCEHFVAPNSSKKEEFLKMVKEYCKSAITNASADVTSNSQESGTTNPNKVYDLFRYFVDVPSDNNWEKQFQSAKNAIDTAVASGEDTWFIFGTYSSKLFGTEDYAEPLRNNVMRVFEYAKSKGIIFKLYNDVIAERSAKAVRFTSPSGERTWIYNRATENLGSGIYIGSAPPANPSINAWIDTSGEEEPIYTGNVLYGKKWYCCGDSFSEGAYDGSSNPENTKFVGGKYDGLNKVYSRFIALRNNMDLELLAVGGATCGMRTDDSQYSNSSFNPLTDKPSKANVFFYDQLPKIGTDADYITLWFGINDGRLCDLGTINDETVKTFYGALNWSMLYLITNFPLAHIGMFVSNQCKPLYRQAVKEVAQKWAIPYLDMEGDVTVPTISGNRENQDVTVDSRVKQLRWERTFRVAETNNHPNEKAHEYQSTFIENWLRSL